MNRGSQHYRAKLDEDSVRLIREAALERERLRREASLLSDKNLAEKFGVTRSAIGRVLYGDAWSHVP